MEDYGSNSDKSRRENGVSEDNKVKARSVVETPASQKEPSAVNKFSKIFIEEDLQTVVSYVLKDMLVPTIKKMLYEGVGIMLGINREDTYSRKGDNNKPSYREYYDRRHRGAITEYPREDKRIVHDYISTKFYSRSDAEAVLAELEAIIEANGYATINDFYIAASMQPRDYTYDDNGWGDLHSARIIKEFSYRDDRTYYYLKLPRAYSVGAE